MKIEEIVENCRNLFASNCSYDEILLFLKTSGVSKVHSIKILVDIGAVDLNSAKVIVHESSVWSDVHERDNEFHKVITDSLDKGGA